MILDPTPFLAFWNELLWGLAWFLIFILSFVLIVVVLMQDSKEGGLGGAFGSAGGGESFLGARGQREIVRFTAVIAILLGVLVVGWGAIEVRTADTTRFGKNASTDADAHIEAADREQAEKDAAAAQEKADKEAAEAEAKAKAERDAAGGTDPEPGAGEAGGAAPSGDGAALGTETPAPSGDGAAPGTETPAPSGGESDN